MIVLLYYIIKCWICEEQNPGKIIDIIRKLDDEFIHVTAKVELNEDSSPCFWRLHLLDITVRQSKVLATKEYVKDDYMYISIDKKKKMINNKLDITLKEVLEHKDKVLPVLYDSVFEYLKGNIT